MENNYPDSLEQSRDIPRMPHFETEQEKRDYLVQLFEAGADWPLVAGGMGIDFSNPPEYVTALIEAGVIPTMTGSAVSLGDQEVYEKMFGKNPMVGVAERTQFFREKNIEVLQSRIADAREKNPHGVIAMNLMAAVGDYDAMLKTVGNAGEKDANGNVVGGIDILCVGAGMPKDLGIKMNEYPHMKYMPIVSSPLAAREMIRYAKASGGKLPHGFYVENPDKAGGHLGAKNIERIKKRPFNASAVIEGIQALIKTEYGDDAKIPVLLAGGMESKTDVDAAKELGYAGGVIGTKALVTKESGVPNPILEDEYFDPLKKIVTTMKSPAGLPSRGVENLGEIVQQTIEEIRAKCIACIGGVKNCKHLQSEGKESYCIAEELGGVRHGLPGTHFTGTILEKMRNDPQYKNPDGTSKIPEIMGMIDLILAA